MPRRHSPLCALLALVLAAAPARAQQAGPLVLRDKLTKEDAPDPLRQGSVHKVHEIKLEAGKPYRIDLLSKDFDPMLRLEDAQGKALAANDDVSPTDLNSRLGFEPAQSGIYRLVVTSFQPGATGAYELRAEALKDAGKPRVFAGKLAKENPVNQGRPFAQFALPVDTGLLYWMEVQSKDFELTLMVLDGGKVVTQADDGSGQLAARLLWEPTAKGDYRAVVQALKPGAVGDYQLTVRPFQGSRVAVAGPLKIVPLPEAPPTVTVGELTKNDPLDRVRQQSFHKLHEMRLEKGKGYIIDLRSADFDAFLRLEDAQGKELASDDDSGGGLNARLLVNPEQTGVYRLVVTSFEGAQIGFYVLSLESYADVQGPRQRDALEREARAWNASGFKNYESGDLVRTREDFQQSLAMTQKLYPNDRYPDGHPDLATSLHNLGYLLRTRGEYAHAEPFYRDALAMRQQLYPKDHYPAGHPDLASSLNHLGYLLRARGEYAQAEPFYRDALAMRQRLYPKDRFPGGHPDLAISLNNLGDVLQARGEYAHSEPFYREALAMWQNLYPKDRFPAGHPDLAIGLNNLGTLFQARGELAQAEPFYRDALAMTQKLYPKDRFPGGHRELAISLHNLGKLLQARGEYAQAEPFYRDALAMNQKLYPKDRFPGGHPDLATSLNNLGYLLQARGEYAQAEPFYRDALAMYQSLYPKDRFPGGHPDLATSLDNLGYLLNARGEYAQAEPFYRDALAMWQKLYPWDRFPGGHPDLAISLNNLGYLLQARGEYAQAEPFYRDALAMTQKLYPKDRFPGGHPELATSLNHLGNLLRARGEYGPAEPFYRDALAMYQKLYPKERFPDGHPDLAQSLNNLGALLEARGEYGKAAELYTAGLHMEQRLANAFAELAAEAEALNFLAKQPLTTHDFLSVTTRLQDRMPGEDYALLWTGKAALMRVLESRRRLLRDLTDQTTRARLEELLQLRHRLASLILAPANPNDKDRGQLLQTLKQRKEDLEKELVKRIPDLARQQARLTTSPTDLSKTLPDRAAFLDLFRYRHHDAKQFKRDEGNYAAFVLRPGQEVRRVELGPAPPIDKALAQWRQDIGNNHASLAPEQLRRLLWDKIEPLLGKGTDTVYLAPDGPLHGLPWAALPGRQKGTVLLEDYALAVVPHGPFLLDQLLHPPTDKGAGALLAVGAVAYDREPQLVAADKRDLILVGPADPKALKARWGSLPGTAHELDALLKWAAALKPAPTLLERRGERAGTAQVQLDLEQARWAHLATHGFFAAPETEERKALLDERLFTFGTGLERRGVGARNPLTQAGLVLAGANLPPKADKEDRGLLTGEAIAGLRLERLRLAVLSACETGLGEVDRGEGVLGLVRAFHLGGTRDVVASLWKVEDEATAALMAVFYHRFWEKGEPPLQALRQAQLALYRHPGAVAALAQPGRPGFAEVLRRLDGPAAGEARAPARSWAAFMLSGPGR